MHTSPIEPLESRIAPAVLYFAGPATLVEGQSGLSDLVFKVVVDPPSPTPLTVNVNTADGSAMVSDGDYLPLSNFVLQIPANTVEKTFTVLVPANVKFEADETFSVVLSSPSDGHSLVLNPTATGTILNDDPLPTISVKSATLVEPSSGAVTMNFIASLSGPADADVEFVWKTIPGTASSADFATVFGYVGVIPAGSTSIVLPVTVFSDALFAEGNEQFQVALSDAQLGAFAVGSPVGGSIATGTIRATPLSVNALAPVVDLLEGTGGPQRQAVFKISRGAEDSLAETIVLKLSTVEGTARPGDYTPLYGGLFTLPSGIRELFVPVGVNTDALHEGNESFHLRIDSAEIGGATFEGIGVQMATATIVDDDSLPTVSVLDASGNEGHAGTNSLPTRVVLSNPMTRDVLVSFSVDLQSGVDAADASDFDASAVGSVTIPAGALSASIPFSIYGDTERENAKTFTVRISDATDGTTPLAITDSTAVVTILPDEPLASITGPAPTAEGSVVDGRTNQTFTVSLDRTYSTNTALRVRTINGPAVGGEDFLELVDKWVLIPAGALSSTLSVSVFHDRKVELSETYSVEVAEMRVGVGSSLDIDGLPIRGVFQPGGSLPSATATITNDDSATLSISDGVLIEGNVGSRTMLFTVSLSEIADRDVTFRYSTQNGVAVAGADFVAASGLVGIIPSGALSTTIFVDVLGDLSDEADESFSVILSEPRVGTDVSSVVIADGIGQGKILNDETTVSIGAAGVFLETEGAAVVEVMLSQVSTFPVNVQLSLTNGSATKGADFADPSALSVTIPAGQVQASVFIPILNDAAFEPDETFDVYIVGAMNAAVDSADRSTVTIVSEDAAPLISFSAESKNEGTKFTATDSDFTDFIFTATLDRAAGSPVIFDWKTLALSGGANATSGDDFVAVPTSLVVIPAGSLSASFFVRVSKEAFGAAVFEADELLSVEVSNVSGATLNAPDTLGGASKTLVATIRNDEAARTLSVGDVSILEGESGTSQMQFTVRLSGAADRDVTFNWQTGVGGANPAALGIDYSAVAVSAVVIPALATEVVLSVPVFGDTLIERDETFLVQISNPLLGGTPMSGGDLQALGVIRNDEIVASIAPAISRTESTDWVEVRIPVSLSLPVPAGETVTVGIDVISGVGASGAVVGSDVNYSGGDTLVFAAGESVKDVVFYIRPDEVSEHTETFTVRLNDARSQNAVVDSANSVSVVTIQDDEAVPVISVESVGAYESSGSLRFVINLDRVASTAVSFDVSTIDFTAVSGLSGDFTAAFASITIPSGNTSASFNVSLRADADSFEGLETFRLRLTNPMGGTLAGGGTFLDATGTIADSNISSVRITSATVAEGNTGGSPSVLSFTIIRSGTSFASVSGNYTISFDALLAAGVFAADAADFTGALSGAFTIAPFTNSTTISIPIAPDTVVEGTEAFRISLSNLQNAFVSSPSDASAVGTITEDDLTIRFGDVYSPNQFVPTLEGESNSELSFPFYLNAPAPTDVRVTFSIASGTAQANVDFGIPMFQSVTIPAGSQSGVFRVPIYGDSVAEPDEYFTLSLISAPTALIDPANNSRVGVIWNDDAAFRVLEGARVEEGQSGTRNLVFEVELADAVEGGSYSVNFSTTGMTATATQDFVPTSGSLTFTGNGVKTVSVPILGDTFVENDETLTLPISNATRNSQPISAILVSSAVGTIQDDESVVSISNVALAEGDSGQQTMNFIVSIPQATTIPISIQYRTVDGTAIGAAPDAPDITGKDFRSISSGTVTIQPGQLTAVVAVTVFGDFVKENTETFQVEFTQISGAAAGVLTGLGTITDNADPSPTIRISDTQVLEGDLFGPSVAKFRVSLSQPANEAVTFRWDTLLSGGASNGDFQDSINRSEVIPVGALFVDVEVPVFGDLLTEGNERFSVQISDARNGSFTQLVIIESVAEGTILDDDAAVEFRAEMSTISFSEDSGGIGTAARLYLDGPPIAGDFSVTYSISAPSGAGSTAARSGFDFGVPTTFTKTFPAGTLNEDRFIEIPLLADSIDEWDEKFVVTLTGASGARVGLRAGSEVTILDNDEAPRIQLADVSVSESNFSSADFPVRLIGNNTERDIVVEWLALSGTAISGADFGAQSASSLFIPSGRREDVMEVGIVNDTFDEGDETFRVAVTSARFDRAGVFAEDVSFFDEVAGERHSALGTIRLNDQRTASVSGGSAVEGAIGDSLRFIDVKIRLDAAPSATPIVVNYTTMGGSAFGGGDFTPVSGSVTFEPGQNEKTVSVPIVSDNLAEADETFRLRISIPGGGTTLLSGSSEAIGTIESDESVFSLVAVSSTNVREGETARFKIVRMGSMDFAAVVSYAVMEDAAASGDARAKATLDFLAKTGTITFAAGEDDSADFGQFIEIPTANDSLAELDSERFLVRLTSAVNGIIFASKEESQVKILDDDAGPDPFVRIESTSANEGGSLRFNVKLVTAAGAPLVAKYPVVISYEALLGAGGAGVADLFDFTGAFPIGTQTLVIAPGQSEGVISIATLQDPTPERSETVFVKLTKVEKNFGGLTEVINPFFENGATTPSANITGSGMILNDDSVITVEHVSQDEGNGGIGTMQFTATIPQPATFDITFDYATRTGNTGGFFVTPSQTIRHAGSNDFIAAAGVVTIPAGQTLAIFSVAVTADDIRENDEIFFVRLSAPQNGILANADANNVAMVNAIIRNDDAGPQLTISSPTINEGSSGAFSELVYTVSLTGGFLESFTVDFATSDGTASASGAIRDYIARSGVLTFEPMPGVSTQTREIRVQVFSDQWKEGDETVKVALSNATGGATLVVNEGIGTILDGPDSTVGVFLKDTSVVEGSAAKFTVGFTALPTGSVTFALNARNGTANASDFGDFKNRVFTFSGNRLTDSRGLEVPFDLNNLTATISVPTVNDSTFEASEHFHLDLGSATGVSIASAGASASATIYNDDFRIVSAREFEFIDEDGDLVNVKVSKGKLFSKNVFGQFTETPGLISIENAGSVGGKRILAFDFLGTGREFEGADLFVTRKTQPGFDRVTDGKVNVGAIIAANAVTGGLQQGVSLGTVRIDGDLGRITVGSAITKLSVARLEVGSLGTLATSFANGVSSFYGRAGAVVVHGDVAGAVQFWGTRPNPTTGFSVGTGSVGSLVIDGKLRGGSDANSGYISSNAKIGKLFIGGGIVGGFGANSGQIFVATSIGSFVSHGDIVGGGGSGSGQVVAGVIGSVEIGRFASKGLAAIRANIIGGEGSADDFSSVSVFAQIGSGAVVSFSGIKSVKMNGNIVGGEGSYSGTLFVNKSVESIVVGDIIGDIGEGSGRLRVAGSLKSLNAGTLYGGGADDSGTIEVNGRLADAKIGGIRTVDWGGFGPITHSGALIAGDIGSVLVSGDISAGLTEQETRFSGAIISRGSIESLTVKGSVKGLSVTDSAKILAAKNIGKVSIHTLRFAEILAGYTDNSGTTSETYGSPQHGYLANADTQIGAVVVEEFFASNIVAGAATEDSSLGGASYFIPDSGVLNKPNILSKIASLTIGHLADGVTSDFTGIVAQKIGAVVVNGNRIPVTDEAAIPGTSTVFQLL